MEAVKSVVVFFFSEKKSEKKKKWTNKGTDKQCVAIFFTQYNFSLPNFLPNFNKALHVTFGQSIRAF